MIIYQHYNLFLIVLLQIKWLKNLIGALFADDDKLFFEEDFVNVTFSSHEICILSVDLNNIKLDDANFYDDDPNVKHFKK